MKKTKGFTLIELLVVIAIIGIISAVVLVTLTNARTKGADANIKSNLVTIRTQADVYYTNNLSSYGTFAAATCPVVVTAGSILNDANIIKAIVSAVASGGGNGSRCVVTPDAFAVAVGMKSSGFSWCVDSTGKSKEFSGTPTSAISGTACQ